MMRAVAVVGAALLALAAAECNRTSVVGSLGCASARDCSPPATICSVDGRCVRGCVADPALCVGGSNCNAATGECAGGAIGTPCTGDNGCDPPDVVCRTSDGTCQPGCTVSPTCADGDVCNPANGHCCAPGTTGCPTASSPAQICSGGMCVPGCATAGLCTGGQVCDTATGHCHAPTPMCTDDDDCDAGSYCTHAGACAVLAYGGTQKCATNAPDVLYACATKTTPADFTTCAGAPGPVGCPYCLENSCFRPGTCMSDNDCHGGVACTSGLCVVSAPACPSTVVLGDVVKGVYAAGKYVCVHGTVQQARQGLDGMYELKLDTSPYLFVDIEPMYQASAGIALPQVGQAITVHGMVRWDGGHADRELVPVDYVGP